MNLIKVCSTCCLLLFGLGGCGIQATSCDSNKSKNMVKQQGTTNINKHLISTTYTVTLCKQSLPPDQTPRPGDSKELSDMPYPPLSVGPGQSLMRQYICLFKAVIPKQYVNREFDKSIANGLQNEVFTEEEVKEIRENMYLHLQHVTILDESEETNTSLCSATLQVRFTDFPSNFKTETDKETERKIQDVLREPLSKRFGVSCGVG